MFLLTSCVTELCVAYKLLSTVSSTWQTLWVRSGLVAKAIPSSNSTAARLATQSPWCPGTPSTIWKTFLEDDGTQQQTGGFAVYEFSTEKGTVRPNGLRNTWLWWDCPRSFWILFSGRIERWWWRPCKISINIREGVSEPTKANSYEKFLFSKTF